LKLSTRAIHSHQEPDALTGAVITPIYQTTTFAQEDAGVHKGWDYTRAGNPTQSVLEGVLAALENGKHGFYFASGLGALTTLCMTLFKAGDHILVEENVYGGTYRLLSKIIQKFGVDVEFVDMSQLDGIAGKIRENTRLVHIETPTNPLMKLVDIEAVVTIAKAKNVLVCVDNTFATPALQLGLELGADIVLHSTTKYLGGHSDVVGGALIVNDDALADSIRFHQMSVGATSDPFASWLTLRGMKTLALRMEAHSKNGLALAQYLEKHPQIEAVFYPGLLSHPQYELAKKQMSGFGGMISIKVKGGEDAARTFMKASKLFILAESLGGVESLVCLPSKMTHASVEKARRDELGITDNLVRLSVGIEDLEDLQADLEQALAAVKQLATV
jgi:cystathionine beta-lyase/cystathionine gamma-synthase